MCLLYLPFLPSGSTPGRFQTYSHHRELEGEYSKRFNKMGRKRKKPVSSLRADHRDIINRNPGSSGLIPLPYSLHHNVLIIGPKCNYYIYLFYLPGKKPVCGRTYSHNRQPVGESSKRWRLIHSKESNLGVSGLKPSP